MERRRTTIGLAVDDCISDASEEWFRQHQGMRSREEAAANSIKAVNIVTERRPGGDLTISVTIVGTWHRESHNDWWRYRRDAQKGYVRIAPSKATG